jgi:hypothetical protein
MFIPDPGPEFLFCVLLRTIYNANRYCVYCDEMENKNLIYSILIPQANRRVSGVSSRCSMETAASVPDISERVIRSEHEGISKEENKSRHHHRPVPYLT